LTGSARPIRTAPGRGRAAALHVTDRGAALRADGQQVISAADETLLAALPADQRVVLGRLLLQVFGYRPGERSEVSGR